jgi:hypothetical protein
MKKPIVAFLYDFDKTLCTTDMQDYAFIPSLGYTPAEFWRIANNFGWGNHMDGLLAYMYTMIDECRKKGVRLERDYLVKCGNAIQLFPGVKDWFSRINAFGESLGVSVEHYVLSSGLKEIIEGSGVAHEFKEIYACEFLYGGTGLRCGPSSTSISRTRRSSSTASTRAFSTSRTTATSTPPCPTTASASRSRT